MRLTVASSMFSRSLYSRIFFFGSVLKMFERRQFRGNFWSGIFGIVFFWFNAKILWTIGADESTCNVVRLTKFKNARLAHSEIKLHCDIDEVECCFKCVKNNTQCASFAVAKSTRCTGTACILYSSSEIDDLYFLEDKSSTYFFLQSPCCNGTCLNGGQCRSERCTCACQKGYSSTNCICPSYNVSKHFSHKWKLVTELEHTTITQIDSSSNSGTWAVDNSSAIYVLENDNWVKIDGSLTRVAAGKSGVWALNADGRIFFREGVTSRTPRGTRWKVLDGLLDQIDAGSSGVVWGVASNIIFCRTGITETLPSGDLHWLQQPLTTAFKYVSCGDYGCWAIRPDNSIAFRTGVTFDYPQGSSWLDVDGSFVQIEAGYQGRVYAVSPENVLNYRIGICAIHPTGSAWKQVDGLLVQHVTVGDGSLFIISINATVFRST